MRPASLVLLAACKGDDDGGNGAFGALPDPEVTIVAEGDGPTNELPLEPMTTGFFGTKDGAVLRWTGPVDAGRDELSVMEVNGPAYGFGTGWFRRMRQGVVTHGFDQPLQPDALPVLLVPDEVRVGMTWDSKYASDEDVVNREVVVSRAVVSLPTGPATVWGIGEYEGETLNSVRWYAEGIGRVEMSPDAETQWNPQIGFGAMVVPLDEQPHVELALDPETLAPLLDPFGRPLTGANYPVGIGAADVDGTTVVVWYGFLPAATPYMSDVYDLTCRALGDPSVDVSGLCPPGATWTRGTGTAVSVAPHPSSAIATLLRARGADAAALWPVDTGALTTRAMPWTNGSGDLSAFTFFGPLDPPATDLVLAAIHSDGRVFEVRHDGAALASFRFVGILPGAVSFAEFDGGLAAYGLSLDLRLHRVRVDGGEVVVESLGSLRIEDETGDYAVTGAVVDPNDPTRAYATVVAFAIDTDGDGYPEVQPFFPDSVLAATLRRDPLPVTAAPALGVGFGVGTGGAVVCWPPTDEPFEASGWTLQGRAASVFGPGGPERNCATIADDGVTDPMYVGAERAIEGPLPGVGRVRLGFPDVEVPIGRGFDRLAAPTVDGGAVDVRGVRLDSAGFEVGFADTGLSSSSVNWGWSRDMAGDGLYEWYTWTVDSWSVGSRVSVPDETNAWAFGGWVADGGAIWMLGGQGGEWQVARPSGSTPVPSAQRAVAVGYSGRVVLDDGRICGLGSTGVACVDSAGVAGLAARTGLWAGSNEPALWALGDGTFALASYGDATTLRFDPATMSITDYDPRSITGFATAADGDVYALAVTPSAEGSALQPVRLAPSGVTAVGDPLPNSSLAAVVPLGDRLWVYDGTAWSGRAR